MFFIAELTDLRRVRDCVERRTFSASQPFSACSSISPFRSRTCDSPDCSEFLNSSMRERSELPTDQLQMGVSTSRKGFDCCMMCMQICFDTHGDQGQAEAKELLAAPSFIKVILDSHLSRFLVSSSSLSFFVAWQSEPTSYMTS